MRSTTSLRPLSFLWAWAAFAVGLPAQICAPAADINAVGTVASSLPQGARTGSGGTWAPDFVRCGKIWFFRATTLGEGAELWKTDGTAAGTTLVKDLEPGANGSAPTFLTCCAGNVFFRARTRRFGDELWVSDGTAAGTRLVKDIAPGSAGASIGWIECLGTRVLFSAAHPASGSELWISDGTAAGTTIVKDVRPGSAGSGPRDLLAVAALGRVFFRADDGVHGPELWVSDGTTAGTRLVKDLRPGLAGGSPLYLNEFAGKVLFRAADATRGDELWVSDGTAAGTVLVKDVRPGPKGSSLSLYYSPRARIGSKLYFTADDGVHGMELWETDGTTAGTRLAADVGPGFLSGRPAYLTAVGSTLFFQAGGGIPGTELYKLSGGRVSLVKDIAPGNRSASPTDVVALDGRRIVFAADDGSTGLEPWVSDGTAAGTLRLADLQPGGTGSAPRWFTVIAPGTAIFAGQNPSAGRELFVTSGTPGSTKLFKDLEPFKKTGSSFPRDLAAAFGSTIYLSAHDGRTGSEPWMHDVRTGRTVRLRDVRSGFAGSNPSDFTPCWTGRRALVFFVADDGVNGKELWVTDGTPTGTRLLEVRRGRFGSFPAELSCFGRRVYFRATDGRSGSELWVSDGTIAGTRMLKDLSPGGLSSSPRDFTACAGKLFFTAIDPTHGRELWVTDGTPAGTKMVLDIEPRSGSSAPGSLVCCRDRLVFRATTSRFGSELWVSDGTAGGTKMVADIASGFASSRISEIVCCGGRVFFAANDGASGDEFWVSDLTAAGTRRVKDIAPGPRSSVPARLVCCNGKVFFRASDATLGSNHELWVSDGTPAGTRLVKDLRPGGSSAPDSLTCVGSRVYFSADVPGSLGGHGRELWISDGTAAGTREVCDLWPGATSSWPRFLTPCGGRLYFTATTPNLGTEPHMVLAPGAQVEVLGEGCAPSFARLRATPPELGRTVLLESGRGPGAHVGFVVVGVPVRAPVVMPFGGSCALWIDLAAGPLLPLGSPSAVSPFTRRLPIPNQPAFEGAQVVAQTLWLSAASIFPIQSSNGVLLALGR